MASVFSWDLWATWSNNWTQGRSLWESWFAVCIEKHRPKKRLKRKAPGACDLTYEVAVSQYARIELAATYLVSSLAELIDCLVCEGNIPTSGVRSDLCSECIIVKNWAWTCLLNTFLGSDNST